MYFFSFLDITLARAGFILVVLGAPLNFIAMLYSVFPICGYIDLYLDPVQELLSEKVFGSIWFLQL